MNREQYIAQLKEQNGYCECPELQVLFAKRKKVQELERKAEEFGSEVVPGREDPEDEKFLGDFDTSFERFIDVEVAYQELLQDYFDERKVVIQVNDYGIETINCANPKCGQQIAVMEED